MLVKIVAPAGADVAVGDVLAEIDSDGAAPDETRTAAPKPEPASAPQPAPETAVAPPEPEAATPVARRMASAQGVDLAQVSGSGPRGRVTKQDVAAHLQGAATPSPRPEATSQRPS
ncbi:E3 binding domain-containing protein, partial [Arthrospira platensis SPKY1]|nr:E3 binding domain-containing protein [Arthrospira platensis SPKY1]